MIAENLTQDILYEKYIEIFEEHRKHIFWFVKRRVNNLQTTEDITQEVFLRAWASIHKLIERESVRGWLITTAKNVMADEIRDIKKRDQGLNELISLTTANDMTSSGRTAEIIDQLNPADREILQLKFGIGLSLEEISKRLGISLSAAKKRSSRAQAKMLKIAEKHKLLKKHLLLLSLSIPFFIFLW